MCLIFEQRTQFLRGFYDDVCVMLFYNTSNIFYQVPQFFVSLFLYRNYGTTYIFNESIKYRVLRYADSFLEKL